MVDFSVLFVVWSGKFCTFKHQETVQVNTYKQTYKSTFWHRHKAVKLNIQHSLMSFQCNEMTWELESQRAPLDFTFWLCSVFAFNLSVFGTEYFPCIHRSAWRNQRKPLRYLRHECTYIVISFFIVYIDKSL